VSWPEGSLKDKNARIFPFKVHRGKQPYDKENKTLLAPMLSGKQGYWTTLNWDESLRVGSEQMGLPFSGQFDFVETTYVFPTTHMVSPKEDTLACTECHVKNNSRLASLAGFYMPGRDSFKFIDYSGWAIVIAALIGVILHALGRIISINNKSEG
ncbi:MAG: cytochrome C, partial [Desulfobacterales bacterium]|nr:cytochrome C [Desulfobacterales bacterium]